MEISYNGLYDRKTKIKENEALSLRLIHDDFEAGWSPGKKPAGILIFTSEEPPTSPIENPIVYLKTKLAIAEAEILSLKGDVLALKSSTK
ncbi:MAG: hypothetical protein ACRKGH_03740 [Dehalogenimonas sp.]